MSRIGNRVLEVPAGVLINLEKNNLKISGTHGEIEMNPHSDLLKITLDDNKVTI